MSRSGLAGHRLELEADRDVTGLLPALPDEAGQGAFPRRWGVGRAGSELVEGGNQDRGDVFAADRSRACAPAGGAADAERVPGVDEDLLGSGVVPGPPDVIAKGSATVLIGNMPAARMSDMTAHGGVIVVGCPTVLIGG